MRRAYIVCTGPVMVPVGEEYVVLVQPTEHKIWGKSIKYVAAPDAGQLQILDLGGEVVFATPINMLLWLKVVQSGGELVAVDGAAETP